VTPERIASGSAPLRLTGGAGDDAVAASLGALVAALRMPARDAEAIREELESHLRERTRDLEIGGMTEEDAVRCAAGELGDLTRLAERYREARAFPRRRLIMNVSMSAVAGVALLVGAVTFSGRGDGARVSVFSPPAPTADERTALSRTVRAEFRDVAASDVFSWVSQTMGMPVNVAWGSLPGIGPDFKISFAENSADFRTILAEVGEEMGAGAQWALGYRVADGVIRVATEDYFDRREMVLASYDLSGFAAGVSDEEVVGLLRNFVHPTGWIDNGGDLARCSLVGNRLFIEAPKRYHVQIQWFVDELSKASGHAAANPTTPPTTPTTPTIPAAPAAPEVLDTFVPARPAPHTGR
jgi:hypothetical protein